MPFIEKREVLNFHFIELEIKDKKKKKVQQSSDDV